MGLNSGEITGADVSSAESVINRPTRLKPLRLRGSLLKKGGSKTAPAARSAQKPLSGDGLPSVSCNPGSQNVGDDEDGEDEKGWRVEDATSSCESSSLVPSSVA